MGFVASPVKGARLARFRGSGDSLSTSFLVGNEPFSLDPCPGKVAVLGPRARSSRLLRDVPCITDYGGTKEPLEEWPDKACSFALINGGDIE